MRSPLQIQLFLLSICCALVGCTRDGEIYSQSQLVEALRHRIATEYVKFEEAIDTLAQSVGGHCTGTFSEVSERTVKENWIAANSTWQQVQVVNFGPIAEQNRAHAIAFYPNSRAGLEKRVDEILQNKGAPLSPENPALSSVSLRGLPAMEYLLFAWEDEDAASALAARRCEYLQVIAELLKEHALELAKQWSSGGEFAQTIGEDITHDEFLEKLLNGINERLSIIVSTKLEKAMSGSTDALESPYANQSLANIRNNFAFIHALYGNQQQDGILRYLKVQGHEDIAKEMSVRLDLLRVNLARLGPDVIASQSSPEDKEKLRTLVELFKSVREYHARKVADAMGVYIGFNSADGD